MKIQDSCLSPVFYYLLIYFFNDNMENSTNTRLYPTFSDKGWVNNPLEKLDYILSHMLAAEDRQTYLDKDKIIAFHALLSEINDNVIVGLDKLKSSIENHLIKYFPERVDCEAYDKSDRDDDPTSGITIVLRITVWEDGVPYTIGKLLRLNDSKFEQLVSLQNNGPL